MDCDQAHAVLEDTEGATAPVHAARRRRRLAPREARRRELQQRQRELSSYAEEDSRRRRASGSDSDYVTGAYDDDWDVAHNATHCYCADRYAGSVDTLHREG